MNPATKAAILADAVKPGWTVARLADRHGQTHEDVRCLLRINQIPLQGGRYTPAPVSLPAAPWDATQ